MDRSPKTGIFFMTLSALCFSCSDIGIKVLGGNLSPWQITTGRGLLGVLVIAVLCRFNLKMFLVRQWPCQMLLGLTGAFGFTCFIISIKYLPLSIALPLSYVFPAIGAMISPLINKERPGRADWIAIALALMAVICLSQGAPSEDGGNFPIGVTFSLIGAFFVALMTNLARRQTQTVLLNVNLFYVFLSNFLVGFPLILFFGGPIVPPAPDLAKLFLVIAPAAIIAFGLMFVAYRHISAHRGGIILTLEAASATIYGLVVLNEPMTFPVVLGGLLILSSGVIIIRAS